MDRDDEAFLRANADIDYMSGRLADLIRNCMRSIAAADSGRRTYQALEDFQALLTLIRYSDGVSGHQLFTQAIDELRPEPRDTLDRAILDAAKCGIQFLIEMSCSDNAAGGRASTRRMKFLDSLKRIEEVRDTYRSRHQT